MKKVITLVLALVLTVSAAIGGTVAYLTSEDSDVNVMTVGNVKIEQHQYQRKDGIAHTATLNEGDLIEAKQGQKLYPAYPRTDDAYEAEGSNLLYWGPYVTGTGAGNGLWNDEKLIGTMDKFVFVENTGKSDAYYRTVIAYECPEGIVYDLEDNAQADIIVNQNGNARFSYSVIGRTTIDGSQYLLVEYLYKEVLKAGEISRPSLLQLVMKGHVTNDQVELFGDTYDVLVYTQACQTENFPSASIALDAAFGDITATTHPWSENAPKIPVVVDNKNEFVEAIKDGDDIVLACDVDLADEVLTIAKNKDVVIHFNGNTISGRSTSNSASSLFDIQTGATLTLKGDGLVSFYATTPDTNWGEGQPKPFPGYANNTVKLTGKLVVDGVTLVNETGKGGASYVIDCYPGADLVVNSGTIKQTGGDQAIRMFANSATVATNVTINGGTISGRRAVWVQLPSSNASVAPIANLTVNGGTLISTDSEYNLAIYSYSYGNSRVATNITLNGGTYYGNVALGGGTANNATTEENVSINNGNCIFYGDVYSYVDTNKDFGIETAGTAIFDKNELANAIASGEDASIVYTGSEDFTIDTNTEITGDVTVNFLVPGTSLVVEDNSQITVAEGASLTINNAVIDTVNNNDNNSFVVDGGTLTFGKGTVISVDQTMPASGVILVNYNWNENVGGKLVLDGAEITGCDNNGRGCLINVAADSKMVIKEGTSISGNKVAGASNTPYALIKVSGELVIDGGSISNNEFAHKALISIESNGKLIINGGEITNNTYTGTGSTNLIRAFAYNSTIEMNGGKIADNYLGTDSSSAVFNVNSNTSANALVVNGGTVSNNTIGASTLAKFAYVKSFDCITISSSADVTGNVYNFSTGVTKTVDEFKS